MADLKYNVIISTDSAIKSLEGFKKVIEGFAKEVKINIDTSALKSITQDLKSLSNLNFNNLAKILSLKPKFDTKELINSISGLNLKDIAFGVKPTLDSRAFTSSVNSIIANKTFSITPKVDKINLPILKALTYPVVASFNSDALRPFGNSIVNSALDTTLKIKNIFANLSLPSLKLPEIDDRTLKNFELKASSFGSSSGTNFGNTFSRAVGNILQITLGNLLANTISSATNAIANQGKQLIGESVNVEKSNTELTVLLGNQAKATKLIKDIQILARTTPYAFPELVESTKNLIAFGVPAEKALEITEKIGNIAFGNTDKLARFSQLYGKIFAQDFVSAGNVNSLTKLNIPIEDLANEVGLTTKEFNKLKSSGKITKQQIVSFEDFDDVINLLTSSTGRFYQASLKTSKTLGGLFSNIPDILGNVIDDLLGVGQGITKLNDGTDKNGIFTVLKNELSGFIDLATGTDYTSITNPLGDAFKFAIETVKIAFGNLQKFINEVFKGVTFEGALVGIQVFVEFIGNVLNKIDFTGIAKGFGSLFEKVDFIFLGKQVEDFVGNIQKLSTEISKTPEFKFLAEITKDTLKSAVDNLARLNKVLEELNKHPEWVESIVALGIGLGAIVFTVGGLFAVAGGITAINVALAILSANPIVVTIITVIGLITGLYIFITKVIPAMLKFIDKLVSEFEKTDLGKSINDGLIKGSQAIGKYLNDTFTKIKKDLKDGWDKFIKGLFTNPFTVEVKASSEVKTADGTTDFTNNLQNDTTAPNQESTGGTNLIDSTTNTYNAITTFISQKLLEIQGYWNGLNVYVQVQLELVKQWFIAKYDEIKFYLEGKFAEFQAFYDSLPAKAEMALEQVKQWFIAKFEEAKIIVSQKIEDIKTFFDSLPQKASDTVDSIKTYFSDGFKKVVTAITSKFEGIGGTIESYFTNIKLPTLTLPPIRLPALPNLGSLLGGQQNYTGTSNFRGGITEIAERGRELVRLPSGIMSLFNDRQFTALPKGTVIYNNQDTERLLNEGYLKGSNVLGGTNNNISSSSVQNTVINRPTNIYSTNYNGYQQSSYLNPLSS
jgi:tape measure domain-containing protein